MTTFKCQDEEGREIPLDQWLSTWSHNYSATDEEEYKALISRCGSFSAKDFETIGQWKDGALKDGKPMAGRWKPNVASVAYPVWMQAASELPVSPGDDEALVKFLHDWSDRKYTDVYGNGKSREKRFGLSRASTLLHFVSGGRFPIFDSRVLTAVQSLTNAPVDYSVADYQGVIRRVVSEIQNQCGTDDLRQVDKALFAYGAWLSESQKRRRRAAREASPD